MRVALKTLVMVPTYNECENAPLMVAAIRALGIDVDVLFVDDDSPDGTGPLLDALAADYPRLRVIHRIGKRGIGGAHLEGIAAAYAGESRAAEDSRRPVRRAEGPCHRENHRPRTARRRRCRAL